MTLLAIPNAVRLNGGREYMMQIRHHGSHQESQVTALSLFTCFISLSKSKGLLNENEDMLLEGCWSDWSGWCPNGTTNLFLSMDEWSDRREYIEMNKKYMVLMVLCWPANESRWLSHASWVPSTPPVCPEYPWGHSIGKRRLPLVLYTKN